MPYSAASRPQADEAKHIAELGKAIDKLTSEMWKLEEKRDRIQAEIKTLQDKILEIGGVRLRSQQVKVEGIKEMSDHANDQLTKAEVGRTKAEKDLAKLEKALTANNEALGELKEETARLEKSSREKRSGLEMVRNSVKQAQDVLETKSEELEELKKLLDDKQADMNKFRARETQLEQDLEKAKRNLGESESLLKELGKKLDRLELHDIEEDDDEPDEAADQAPKAAEELKTYTDDELQQLDAEELKAAIVVLEEEIGKANPNMAVLKEYKRREKEFLERALDLEKVTAARDEAKATCDGLRKQRLDEFMAGFQIISMRLKEMYQLITMGGNAELELVDSLDPFSEGILFSVMPPKKSWKNISNLSGGEKTLSSLAMIFALHVYRPTPLYFMDEIDAALGICNFTCCYFRPTFFDRLPQRERHRPLFEGANKIGTIHHHLAEVRKKHGAKASLTVCLQIADVRAEFPLDRSVQDQQYDKDDVHRQHGYQPDWAARTKLTNLGGILAVAGARAPPACCTTVSTFLRVAADFMSTEENSHAFSQIAASVCPCCFSSPQSVFWLVHWVNAMRDSANTIAICRRLYPVWKIQAAGLIGAVYTSAFEDNGQCAAAESAHPVVLLRP